MADDIPDDEDLHARALRHLDEAWTAETENFDAGREDQRFSIGEQWLTAAKEERLAANRPVITVNRIPAFVRQVTGDARRDTPAIKVAPSKDGASQETADIYNGLIRNIEVESNAKAAYVQALENACVTGLGVMKVVTQYSDNDGFNQDIRIKRIVDPFAVIFDPAAKEPDKSDARYVAEFVDIPKEEFKRQYPDAATDSVPSGPNSIQGLNWYTMESVRVAYYWYKEPAKKTLLQLADGRTIDGQTALKEAEAGGAIEVLNKRVVDTHVVKMCIISGNEVLEKPVEWAGQYIPYAPVIGEEHWVDGRCVRKGMVRDAKDPQRVYNYMRTAAVEGAALQPKSPWLVTVDMIKGLEKWWRTAGSKNHPYLPYKPDKNAPGGKPERAAPVLAQQGLDQQSLIAADELKAITGIHDASLGARSNETSGRAILARQKEGETGTYHYIDNLATGIRFCGRILVDLIPKIYDTERVVRVLKEDGTHEMAKVNAEQRDDMGAFIARANDLSAGEYDVTVITGPSFSTRRQESRETVTELVRAQPQLLSLAGDIIFRNMDFPGADEIAKRVERTIPPQVRDDEPQAPPPPSPEDIKDMADAEKAKAEAEGKQLENLGTMVALLQQLQGIPQQIEMLKQAVAQATAPAQEQPPQGEPQLPQTPGGPDGGLPPDMPQEIDLPAQPMGGEGEIVDLPAEATPIA